MSLKCRIIRHGVVLGGVILSFSLLTIAASYFVVLYGLGVLVPGQLSSWSLVALAALNFALLFLIVPFRARVQQAIDRIIFRQRYDVETALSGLSLALASAHAVPDVVSHARRLLQETLCPTHAAIFLRTPHGVFREVGVPDADGREITPGPGITSRLQRGDVVARSEWEDGRGRPAPPIWSLLDAELIVPLRMNGTVIGLLMVAPKTSGYGYSANDTGFLRTAANQIALALANAGAFSQLEELNANLERIVRERTGALHASNAELNRSLEELQRAYEKLEQSQASLLRADRLATLGRLTAGIAHEMNTPLSAVLNALKILSDLGEEYRASIDDPAVLAEDHREIAGEIVSNARTASEWARKAAAYISSVKAHGREARPAVSNRAVVRVVVAEMGALLSHRLRTSSCRIDFKEEPEGIALRGDPSRLSQVLLNLCTNAIDAYEDHGATGGRIQIRLRHCQGNVELSVTDWAGGIPDDVAPHIFDELFTTKGPGRGTGLGLWIARNLIEQTFGGRLTVETTKGVGSCFTASFPASVIDTDVTAAEPVPGKQQGFWIAAEIERCRAQVAERLQAAACDIVIEEDPDEMRLTGDPTLFRRALTGLLESAMTAYAEIGETAGRIELGVRRGDGTATITVRHFVPTARQLSGAADSAASAARDILEQHFGGLVDVLRTGGSTCFIAVLPNDAAEMKTESIPTGVAQPLHAAS